MHGALEVSHFYKAAVIPSMLSLWTSCLLRLVMVVMVSSLLGETFESQHLNSSHLVPPDSQSVSLLLLRDRKQASPARGWGS